jgi:hypothetical protein
VIQTCSTTVLYAKYVDYTGFNRASFRAEIKPFHFFTKDD